MVIQSELVPCLSAGLLNNTFKREPTIYHLIKLQAINGVEIVIEDLQSIFYLGLFIQPEDSRALNPTCL